MAIRNFFRWRHRWYAANVDAFVDDELAPAERARFERHLAGCSDCAPAVRQAQGLKRAVGALPEIPVMRSFAVTETMLRRPQVAAPRRGLAGAALRTSQGLVAASIAALSVLVVVDVAGSGSGAGSLASPESATLQASADSADPVAGTAEGDSTMTAESARPASDTAGTETPTPETLSSSDGGGDDSGGGVSGAGIEPPPEPTPQPKDDSASGEADESPGAPDRTTIRDTQNPPAALTTEYFASPDDDGGWPAIRYAEVAAAAVALAAVAGYLLLRRRQNRPGW